MQINIQKVKDAVYSAADVMQGMASTMCFLLSKVTCYSKSLFVIFGIVNLDPAVLVNNKIVRI